MYGSSERCRSNRHFLGSIFDRKHNCELSNTLADRVTLTFDLSAAKFHRQSVLWGTFLPYLNLNFIRPSVLELEACMGQTEMMA